MTPIRANIVGPPLSATRISASQAALLRPGRDHLLDIAGELPEMNGEAFALLHIRRASGDLLRIVGFCALAFMSSMMVLLAPANPASVAGRSYGCQSLLAGLFFRLHC
jgi:hypothetical protein